MNAIFFHLFGRIYFRSTIKRFLDMKVGFAIHACSIIHFVSTMNPLGMIGTEGMEVGTIYSKNARSLSRNKSHG